MTKPDWMSDDEEGEDDDKPKIVDKEEEGNEMIDPKKLQNLLARRDIYGDITQNVSERQIMRLLVR